jgi:outer membrane protein assembly factor BamA
VTKGPGKSCGVILRGAVLWVALLLATAVHAEAAENSTEIQPVGALPSGAELEAAGAIIGDIVIDVGDVFDTSIEGEDGWLYRTANKLHINTKPSVISGQLLFKTGDPYRQRIIDESERILRAKGYLYDARIVPTRWDGHTVDLEVRTRDNWTLNPGISFSRKGGANTFGLAIEEDNLLGTGQEIGVEYDDNPDRKSVALSFFDPHFRHSFDRLGITYADADDGDAKILSYSRPFYSLDSQFAAGIYLNNNRRNDSRYELGKNVGEFEHRQDYYEVSRGWSKGLQGRWVRRWTAGFTYSRDRFAPDPEQPLGGPLPEDREFVYPWIGWELLENGFQERVNQDQILRTEDVLVGRYATARLGYAPTAFGSDRNALIASASLRNGADLDSRQSVFGSVSASGRLEGDEIANGILSAEARYYLSTSRRSKFYAAISGALTERLDTELQLLLGGDNGLRGYPLRYQAGTARALFTVEERFYTNWYPFRLFHVGAAAFFDMGRTWGTDVTGEQSLGLLRDIGIGLRLGSSRSSFGNVLHVDLAFPLDGGDDIDSVQLLVQTKGSF